MDFLSKLFQQKGNKPQFVWNTNNKKRSVNQAAFHKDDIRLIIFKYNEASGRKKLFDSHQPPEHSQTVQSRQASDGCSRGQEKPSPGANVQRQLSDSELLAEMVFGSTPLSCKVAGLKIHEIRTPPQLMLTKLFMNTARSSTSSRESVGTTSVYSSSSSLGSDSGTASDLERTASCSNLAQGVSSARPSQQEEFSKSLDYAVPNRDQPPLRFFSSLSSSPGAGNAFALKRLDRCRSTSFEHGAHYRLLQQQTDRQSQLSLSSDSMRRRRPSQYGIAVLLATEGGASSLNNVPLEDFIFAHITLVTGHIEKLQTATQSSLTLGNIKDFTAAMNTAYETFFLSLCDLYMAPRLESPVWLDMISLSTQKTPLCQKYVKHLIYCWEKYEDRGSSHHFLSSLLTVVLTNHLGWVPTVAPAGAYHSMKYLDKHTAKWLDTLAKTHPYNPLWAQLGDLYGAIGQQLRMCRTVVTGSKQAVVYHVLYLLSYFIRCTQLRQLLEPLLKVNYSGLQGSRQTTANTDHTVCTNCGRSVSTASSKTVSTNMDALTVHNMGMSDATLDLQEGPRFVFATTEMEEGVEMKQYFPAGGPCGTALGHLDDPMEDLHSAHPGMHCDDPDPCQKARSDDRDPCQDPQLHNTDPCQDPRSDDPDPCQDPRSDDPDPCQDPHSEDPDPCQDPHSKDPDPCQDPHSKDPDPCQDPHSKDPDPCQDPHSKDPDSCQDAHSDDPIAGKDALSVHPPRSDSACPDSHSTQPCARPDVACSGATTVMGDVRSSRSGGHVTRVRLSPGSTGSSSCPSLYPSLSGLEGGTAPALPRPLLLYVAPPHEPEGDLESTSHRDVMVPSIYPDLSEGQSPGGRKTLVKVTSPKRHQHNHSGVDFHSDPQGHQPGGVGPGQGGQQGLDKCQEGERGCTTVRTLEQQTAWREKKDSHQTGQVEPVETGQVEPVETGQVEPVETGQVEPVQTGLVQLGPVQPCEIRCQVVRMLGEAQLPVSAQSELPLPGAGLFFRMDSQSSQSSLLDFIEGESLPYLSTQDPCLSSDLSTENSCMPPDLSTQDSCMPPGLGEESVSDDDDDCSLSTLKTVHTLCEELVLCSECAQGLPDHMVFTSDVLSATDKQSRAQDSQQQTGHQVPLPPLPSGLNRTDMEEILSKHLNLGYSLLAGFSPHYMADFVLQGTCDSNLINPVHTDLETELRNSVLDEDIVETCCVVADTDKWTVKLYSCIKRQEDRLQQKEVQASRLVTNLLQTIHQLARLKMSPEFCLMHLEDQLQELYLKSQFLAECLKTYQSIQNTQLADITGVDVTDLDLLKAIGQLNVQTL